MNQTFLLLCIIAVVLVFNLPLTAHTQTEQEFLIASWNLLNFGQSRANVDENLQTMTNIMTGSNYSEVGRNYDLIFVQELRSNGVAFDNLCNDYLADLDYSCLKTSQLSGAGSNSESYGVIFKNSVEVSIEDTSNETTLPHIPQGEDSTADEMVRPPMKATVTLPSGLKFVVYNNHIEPGDPDTTDELFVLQDAIDNFHGSQTEDKIIVLGDLNADGKPTPHHDGTICGSQYLVGGFENHPGLFDAPNWRRIFTNSNYTNFADNPCAYDKIIPNHNMGLLFTGNYGIIGTLPDGTSFGRYPEPGFKAGDKHISDHKLIWAEFRYAADVVDVDETEDEVTDGAEDDTTSGNNFETDNGGGCLIATAAFGSELVPQVQLLREIRDNIVFSTNSGTTFMATFNNIYYSFSPTIADWERQNPMLKETIKTAIAPMLSTLSILNYVVIDSEQEMLGYGIGLILLNIGMYFVIPAIIILKLKSRLA
jgi:hypothetical protein